MILKCPLNYWSWYAGRCTRQDVSCPQRPHAARHGAAAGAGARFGERTGEAVADLAASRDAAPGSAGDERDRAHRENRARANLQRGAENAGHRRTLDRRAPRKLGAQARRARRLSRCDRQRERQRARRRRDEMTAATPTRTLHDTIT